MKKIAQLILALFVFSIAANAQQSIGPSIPDMVFDGSTTKNLGKISIPDAFEFTAEVKVNNSNEWRHLIEVGAVEYVWNAPMRIETGNEGIWYLSIGDGNTYYELTMDGGWKYGEWMDIKLTYKDGEVIFYQNGQAIGSRSASFNPSLSGTLILGSMQERHRWFEGEMKNAKLIDLSAPAPAPIEEYDDSVPITSNCGNALQRQASMYNGHYTTFTGRRFDVYQPGEFYMINTRLEEAGNKVFRVQALKEKFNTMAVVKGVGIALESDKVRFTIENRKMIIHYNDKKEEVRAGNTYESGTLKIQAANNAVQVSLAGYTKMIAQINFNPNFANGIYSLSLNAAEAGCLSNFGMLGIGGSDPSKDASIKQNFETYKVPARKSLFE